MTLSDLQTCDEGQMGHHVVIRVPHGVSRVGERNRCSGSIRVYSCDSAVLLAIICQMFLLSFQFSQYLDDNSVYILWMHHCKVHCLFCLHISSSHTDSTIFNSVVFRQSHQHGHNSCVASDVVMDASKDAGRSDGRCR